MPPRCQPERAVPTDTKCAVCGKPRSPLAVQHEEPYCSTACATRDHGVPVAIFMPDAASELALIGPHKPAPGKDPGQGLLESAQNADETHAELRSLPLASHHEALATTRTSMA